MLNNEPAKGSSPKKEGGTQSTLKLSLSGNTSPYSNNGCGGSSKFKKSAINFVHDMKKHGIDKDLDSVRAMRQFLESSSPQSVSPTVMMPVVNY
jgi:hypothetical protein